ncbi:hypothetical protein GQ457_05G022690 [Hibiscus cannabinus]
MTVWETLGKGAKTGKGFGKNLQGSLRPQKVIAKNDHFGLGHKPSFLQRKEEYKRREQRRRARFRGEDAPWKPMFYPHIRDTFTFGGIVNAEQKVQEAIQESDRLREEVLFSESLEGMLINMTTEDNVDGRTLASIRPCVPREALNNWSSIDLPVIFRSISE